MPAASAVRSADVGGELRTGSLAFTVVAVMIGEETQVHAKVSPELLELPERNHVDEHRVVGVGQSAVLEGQGFAEGPHPLWIDSLEGTVLGSEDLLPVGLVPDDMGSLA